MVYRDNNNNSIKVSVVQSDYEGYTLVTSFLLPTFAIAPSVSALRFRVINSNTINRRVVPANNTKGRGALSVWLHSVSVRIAMK